MDKPTAAEFPVEPAMVKGRIMRGTTQSHYEGEPYEYNAD
jgi:hypothetical protein